MIESTTQQRVSNRDLLKFYFDPKHLQKTFVSRFLKLRTLYILLKRKTSDLTSSLGKKCRFVWLAGRPITKRERGKEDSTVTIPFQWTRNTTDHSLPWNTLVVGEVIQSSQYQISRGSHGPNLFVNYVLTGFSREREITPYHIWQCTRHKNWATCKLDWWWYMIRCTWYTDEWQ